jgi:hypothetical protein
VAGRPAVTAQNRPAAPDRPLPVAYGTYPLVASNARYAARTGICVLCGQLTAPGQRICTLANDSGDAHVSCVVTRNDDVKETPK